MLRTIIVPVLLIFLFTGSTSETFSADKKLVPHYYKNGISDRSLLKSSRPNFYLVKPSSSTPDTLSLLAIRVEFQPDNDRSTTGNGKFDLSHTSEYFINPPPHDRRYFTNQLLALADYYNDVSHGRLVLNGEVYPKELNEAYLLPHQMSYYNPNTTDELLDQRLAELFRDSFIAADTTDTIDFSNYDCFIIFHAGVGAEYTLELDTTPNDIPSVFLSFQDLKKTIGKDEPNFAGILVANNIVREGIILPETENQMGYDIGLLGTTALMFGHQLGLPNLYDSDTGHPGIGVFGLMDQGSSNFSGLLPAQLCAWSKIFLGWEEPLEVTAGTDLRVAAALAANENKIYKVPINAKEYFLIENRQRHIKKKYNIAIGEDEHGLRVEFKDDGNISPPSSQDTIGVIIHVDEYDFGLPGSGILIWHIDEKVIEEHYHENRVNTDMYHRGVDLVEADGAQDIGHFFNFFGITGYESGSQWDLWWADNEAHQQANDSKYVAFTPSSMPNSGAYSGANSHIFITNFSDVDSIMTFTLSIETYHANFPQHTAADLGINSVVIGNLNNDPGDEIVAASIDGRIFAWNDSAQKIINNSDSLTVVDLRNDTTKSPLALFADINDAILNTPALGDLDLDGDMELIVGAKSGMIYVFQGIDSDKNGRADTLFTYNCDNEITTSPLIVNLATTRAILVGHYNGQITAIGTNGSLIWQEPKKLTTAPISGLARYSHSKIDSLVVTTRSGSIYLINQFGEIQWQQTISDMENLSYPAIGDINRDGILEIIVCGEQGSIAVLDKAGNRLPQFDHTWNNIYFSNPTIADLDNNGYLEIVIASNGCIFAFNYNGTLVENFPIIIDREKQGKAYPEPIVADLDGDDDAELIIAANTQVMAFHHTGEQLAGFPLSVDSNINSTPFLSDLDKNEKINLAVVTDDGYIYVWDLGFHYEGKNIFWGSFLHDVQHTGLFSLTPTTAPPTAEELMPASSVYNYPNPTAGNSTTIRYWLSDAADVNIRIYDMAGELVTELNGTGFAQTDNEVHLNLQDIQSGVYLTRVEAKGSNKSNVSFFKMAVVK